MKNISEVLDIFCILLSMIITWSTHVKNKNKWNFTVKASTLYSMYLNKKKKKVQEEKKDRNQGLFFLSNNHAIIWMAFIKLSIYSS